MPRFVIKEGAITPLMEVILSLPLDGTMAVEVTKNTKDRSLAQNRLTHMHYRQIGEQTGNPPAYTKAECKLNHAVPILLDENAEFAGSWGHVAVYLDYEQQIELAGMVDMTSIMNLTQMTNYINDYMNAYQANGIHLNHPEDLIWEAIRQ